MASAQVGKGIASANVRVSRRSSKKHIYKAFFAAVLLMSFPAHSIAESYTIQSFAGSWRDAEMSCEGYNEANTLQFGIDNADLNGFQNAEVMSLGKAKCELSSKKFEVFFVVDAEKCEASGMPRELIGEYSLIDGLPGHIRMIDLEGNARSLAACELHR